MAAHHPSSFLRAVVIAAAIVLHAFAYKAAYSRGVRASEVALRLRLRQTPRSSSGAAWFLLRSTPSSDSDSSSSSSSIPKPKIIEPSTGVSSNEGKFMMMYTCKICTGRNAHMISKVAFNYGMVVASCKHCKNKHLIADNEGKLDMKEYGKTVEEYLISQGETVQRLNLTPEELEKYYLVDQDGKLQLVPKEGGQPDPRLTIVDTSKAQSRGFGRNSSQGGV